MSGLGDRKKIGSKEMDERYEALAAAASTRSLLSLGISCFTLTSANSVKQKVRFKCITFNILTFCATDFVVEPKSLEFLVKHGFDFNVQYAKGVVYYPGADRGNKDLSSKTKKTKIASFCLRQLFVDLLSAKKPVVLHNSFLDLIFLYQHLYGPLPKTLQTFLADVNQLFPKGIYDTKYIVDYHLHFSASFLQYIFRKSQRETLSPDSKCHLSVRFKKLPDFAYQFVVYALCPQPVLNFTILDDAQHQQKQLEICTSFAAHGHCHTDECKKSHDVDLILNLEDLKRDKKRTRRKCRAARQMAKASIDNESSAETLSEKQSITTDDTDFTSFTSELSINLTSKKKRRKLQKNKTADNVECENLSNLNSTNNGHVLTELLCLGGTDDVIMPDDENKTQESIFRPDLTGAHRAGFDSFMTGYSLAYFALVFGHFYGEEAGGEFCAEEFKNRISLSGKEFPLIIQSSTFAKTSTYHDIKYRSIIENE